MSRTVIVLVRHGEVENPGDVLYGRLPGFGLSDLGKRQADAVARLLTQPPLTVDVVISSPLERAQQTAAPIASAAGVLVLTDDRLTESGNVFEGMHKSYKLSYGRPDHWRYLYNPWRPSWGEPYRHIAGRMLAVVGDARRDHPGERVVLVSHQSPIWVLRRSLEGRTLFHDPRRRQCAHSSATTLTFDGEALAGIGYEEPGVRV